MQRKKKQHNETKKLQKDSQQLRTIEVEAATTKEAIKKALDELNAGENDVLIEVLKEERKGLFGMEGAHRAKIRATLQKSEHKK